MNDFFAFLDELATLAVNTSANVARYKFEYRGGIVEITFRQPRKETGKK